MTFAEAQSLALSGTSFGTLYPMLELDAAEQFKEWWLREPKVPVNFTPPPPKNGQPSEQQRARSIGYTGDMCKKCGSVRVRQAGNCTVCEQCGDSGCS